jgi:hypothetical protein
MMAPDVNPESDIRPQTTPLVGKETLDAKAAATFIDWSTFKDSILHDVPTQIALAGVGMSMSALVILGLTSSSSIAGPAGLLRPMVVISSMVAILVAFVSLYGTVCMQHGKCNSFSYLYASAVLLMGVYSLAAALAVPIFGRYVVNPKNSVMTSRTSWLPGSASQTTSNGGGLQQAQHYGGMAGNRS